MNELLPIGTKVNHIFRGEGTIVKYNENTIIDSVYNGHDYPYVVVFKDGYRDFYAQSDLTPIT